MKTVAIYFSDPGILDYPLNKKVYYESYHEIISVLLTKKIKAVIVRANSYLGKGEFNHYFEWNQNEYQLQTKPIKVDLIWNRDANNTLPEISDCTVLNSPKFDEICRNKWKTYQHLKEFCSKTYLVQTFKEAQAAILKISGSKIVLKPHTGEQAQGVYVLEKNEVTSTLYSNWSDIIVQEFIDSSAGLPNITQGNHEINVSLVNGKFAGCRLKILDPGTLIATVTGEVGGCEVRGICSDEVPNNLWQICLAIDKKFTDYQPRMFRADFCFNGYDYKLIEINSRPGVSHPEKEGKNYWDFNGAVIETICDFFSN